MMSWVVKVVPQPPAPTGKLVEEDNTNASMATDTVAKKEEVKQEPNPAKPKEEVSEENSSKTGVLSWLSNGFNSALPQPVNTSKLQEENAVSNRTGMIGLIVQELVKVVPQPDEKCKGHTEPEEVTEVHEIKDLHDAEPLPHIPVVEIVSDEEPDAANTLFSPSVIEWIMHGFEKIIPQSPIHLHPPSDSETPAQRAVSAPVTPCKQQPAAPAPKAAPTPKTATAPAAPAPEPHKAVEDSKGSRLQQECVAEDLAQQAAELAVRKLEEEHSTQINTVPKRKEPDTEDQKMLTKDKKPADEKGEVKETAEIIPPHPETPKLYKAALKVGAGETFAKLKEVYKGATLEPSTTASGGASTGPVPPPSPIHRRSPIPRPRFPDEDDMVSETNDSTMIIRMTPRVEGEEILSVEVTPVERLLVGTEDPSKTEEEK
ncbi:fibrous sheath CABYR-binding protein-like isoform X2 [Xyrauchen texanus]|uniref:fibrous sheath CABYR-binding protein-like isoform X2 n=1 Tax=Xyrauchen texanus TaxID=154827 RepID=UPI002241B69F|nr:fibrous sheath CABYR-binding protein-like isoform X2 [Xyrauchen texanus]